MLTFHTYPDRESLYQGLAQDWLQLAQTKGGTYALAGGTTPEPVYRALDALLAQHTHPAIRLVATDERWVDDADAQSNEGLIRRCFAQSGTPLVSLKTEASAPTEACAAINIHLQEHFPQAFTAIVLGMGTDGHIASLFPHAPEQLQANDARRCVPATHPTNGQARISLSFSRLLDSERIWLLITGEEKRRVLEQAETEIAATGSLTSSSSPNKMHALTPISALLQHARCPVDVYWSPA